MIYGGSPKPTIWRLGIGCLSCVVVGSSRAGLDRVSNLVAWMACFGRSHTVKDLCPDSVFAAFSAGPCLSQDDKVLLVGASK